jgi:hypothetical protein
MDCWGLFGDIAGQVGANDREPPPSWFQASAAPAPAAAPIDPVESAKKRDEMIALVSKWMPTTLLAPKIPENETRDLLAVAGWSKQRGIDSKAQKDAGVPVVTSCGDVLTALLKMWRSNILGAFNIRDQTLIPTDNGQYKIGPGAMELGLYIKADGTNKPQRGDIIVLKYPPGHKLAGYTAHVAIFIKEIEGVYDDISWQTASGGGGTLPDQSASIGESDIVGYVDKIPKMKSPTDNMEKVLDGWISLDKLTQTGNWTY